MKKLSNYEIQEFVNQFDPEQYPKINISVLRNIMVETIEPYLKYYAYKAGFNVCVQFGEYDNIFQETVGGQNNVINDQTDIIMIFSKIDILSLDITNNFSACGAKQMKEEVDRIKEYINAVINGIRSKSNAIILWHGFELPVYPAFGISDSQNAGGQLEIIKDLNKYLLSRLLNYKDAFFVDMNLLISRVGSNNFYDSRYWHIGRAPFSSLALHEIVFEDFKFVRALNGKNKKCLVLDCDNLLWGGNIGEEGLNGIKLGKTHPGSAYYEFQQEVLNLYNRGVIITLCSKNNEEDVLEVLRNHPDMILREEHIANAQINWQDKATNIKQLATDLNIGLDSIVFMDDSEFEVNLVQEMLPEVTAIHMHPEKTVEFKNILASYGLFDTLTLTEEDKRRGEMYKTENARKSLKHKSADMLSYFKSLKMEIEIYMADEYSIPRIAQLTQKTNQFNLTTKRYSDTDIKNYADSNNSNVIYLKLKDRFGDYGIIGVAIIKHLSDSSEIDTFLLSCRAIGRGVEDVLLGESIELSRKLHKKSVCGWYVKTKRNWQVADFYKKHNFCVIEKNDTGTFYRLDTTQQCNNSPEYFKDICVYL